MLVFLNFLLKSISFIPTQSIFFKFFYWYLILFLNWKIAYQYNRVFRRILLKLHNVKNPNRMMFVPFCSKWSAHFWFLRTAASSKELKRRMTSYIHNLIMVGWSFTSHWVINPQNHSIYIKRVSFYHLFSTLLIQFKLVYGLFWQSNM